MTMNQYDSLVTELTSFIQKYKELEKINKDAEFDLKWRLTELFKSVKETDEQKFIDISGMHGHLITTAEKKDLSKIKKETISIANQKTPGNKIGETTMSEGT